MSVKIFVAEGDLTFEGVLNRKTLTHCVFIADQGGMGNENTRKAGTCHCAEGQRQCILQGNMRMLIYSMLRWFGDAGSILCQCQI